MPAPRTVLPSRQEPDEPGRLLLDRAWQFHRGGIPFPEVKDHGWTYANAKAGQAQGPAATNFDDSDWESVDLPHDWAVEMRFDKDANPSQGYRPRGFARDRRTLLLESEDRGKYLELQLGAIAAVPDANVQFGGDELHRFSRAAIAMIAMPVAIMACHVDGTLECRPRGGPETGCSSLLGLHSKSVTFQASKSIHWLKFAVQSCLIGKILRQNREE